ncbi:MAG: hypothetical protein BWY49_01296 [Candidatus Omnitrophica bacterium ADurb.Bin314]|jgi:hypothetical protein|nr:MAG: hypothetical protein BWY49_01296 [Candidatus Omnitrophica bacterium ADurb.Bin314]
MKIIFNKIVRDCGGERGTCVKSREREGFEVCSLSTVKDMCEIVERM